MFLSLLSLRSCATAEEMGGLIQQRLKDQALAEGGQYVGAKEQGSADKVKYNRAREPWKAPTHAPQKKPSAGGGAAAMPEGRTYSTSHQQGKLMSDLNKRLGKLTTPDSKGKDKAGKKPPPPPTNKPRQQRPEESQPLYGNADAANAHVYGNLDFGNQIYANTEFETDPSGRTKEVPRKAPRMRPQGKASPAHGPSVRPPPTVPPRGVPDEEYYDYMDGEIYEDMNGEEEEMYVVPNPGEEEED